MNIFDDIRRDREAGTPGPWKIHDCESYGDRSLNFYQEVWNDETDILVTTEVTRAFSDGGAANVRRIARTPIVEDIALAAEDAIAAMELAEAQLIAHGFDGHGSGLTAALAKLREATA